MKSDVFIHQQKEMKTDPEPLSLEDALQMLHAQQDHQAELEMHIDDLRRKNETLENKIRQIQEPSPSPLVAEMNFRYQLFPDGCSCFPYASDAIRELFEVTPEQVCDDASPVFAVIHPDDYYGFVASMQNSARTLQPWEYEYRVTLPKQGLRRHLAIARPQSQKDGSVLWDGIIKDVTAQKGMGTELVGECQAVEKTNRILATIHENMFDWLWEVDSEWRYTFCSPQCKLLLGYTADELVGKTLFDFMLPEDAERIGVQLMEIRRLKLRIIMLEHRYIHKDGRRILSSTSGIPIIDANGNLMGYRGIDRDITEQKRIEGELYSLSRAVQQSPVSIVITDTKGLIEFVNPKFTELTGYTVEEAIGQNPRILNAGKTPPEVFVELWRTITAGKIWKGEVLNKAKDGTLFWEASSISPLYDEHGVITHYLAVKEDITEKKHISDQLVIAKKKAEAATEAKSTFLSTMSHEIRTPMNGVIGMTSLLLDTELNTEQLEYAEIVRKSAENLLSIINELLDFSKIEAGKLDLETLDFDLRPTIEDTAEQLAFRAADKGLELICSIEPEVPSYLKGDPGRLRQIIINLVGNAIKFTDQGEIVINASLAAEQDGVATILFKISDTGIGIPAEKLDAVFTPFTQVESSTSRTYGGTGLGLTICKQLAELMGGEVGVTSESGKGSTFWFTARFDKQSTQADPAAKHATTALRADISGTKILVVTNNVTNRTLVTTLLHQWGCNFEAAADGENALELLRLAAQRKEPFRLVLMDQKMPGMDGRELGSRIKADSQLESTLMVMLTAAGQRGDVAALKQIGFDGYLAKPVRPNQLRDGIALVLVRSIETQNSDLLPKPEGIVTRHTVAECRTDRFRILVAEDNINNQKVAQGMLKMLGYKSDVVANGLEAVRALELVNYDLVLMDCMMPEMDGFAATAAIRDSKSLVLDHNITIVAMTANALPADRDACIAAGMNDYMSKPVRKDKIAEILEKWILQKDTKETIMNTLIDQPDQPLLFDEAELLDNFGGERDFAESILQDSLQELPGEIKTLCELAEGEDAEAIRHQAHTLKGIAATMCAPVLREICYKIETAAHDKNLESVRKLLPELEQIVSATDEAIRNRKSI